MLNENDYIYICVSKHEQLLKVQRYISHCNALKKNSPTAGDDISRLGTILSVWKRELHIKGVKVVRNRTVRFRHTGLFVVIANASKLTEKYFLDLRNMFLNKK